MFERLFSSLWNGCKPVLHTMALFLWLFISLALAQWLLSALSPGWEDSNPFTVAWQRSRQVEMVLWMAIICLPYWIGALFFYLWSVLKDPRKADLFCLLILAFLAWLLLGLGLISWYFPGWPLHTSEPLTGLTLVCWLVGCWSFFYPPLIAWDVAKAEAAEPEK